jgi:hypothetical protein
MDIVSRVWRRYAIKVLALTTNPKKVEGQFKVLEDALHALAAGAASGDDLMQGEMFQHFSLAIDAYREILYFIRKVGTQTGTELEEGRFHNLALMSKHPFAADEVLQHGGPHVFVRALGEAHVLRQMFDAAKGAMVGTSATI